MLHSRWPKWMVVVTENLNSAGSDAKSTRPAPSYPLWSHHRIPTIILMYACILLFFVGVIIMALPLFYTVPSVDDFCNFSIARGDIVESYRDFTERFTGRYTAALLQFVPELSDPESVGHLVANYQITLIVNYALFIVSIFIFCWSFFKVCVDNLKVRYISNCAFPSLLFFSIITSSSSLNSFLYWVPGVANYTFGLLLFLFTAIWMFQIFTNRIRGSIVSLLFLLIVVFLCGIHELYAVYITCLATVFLIGSLSISRRFHINNLWLVLAIVVALASVAYQSSLNAVQNRSAGRFSFSPTELLYDLLLSVVSFLGITAEFLGIVCVMFILFIMIICVRINFNIPHIDRLGLLFTAVGLLAGVFGCQFLAFFATDVLLPPRANNIQSIMIIMSLVLLTSVLMTGKAVARLIENRSVSDRKVLTLVLVVSVFALCDRAFVSALWDVVSHGDSLVEQFVARDQMLRTASGSLAIAPLPIESVNLLFGEIFVDPRSFANKCVAEYYGLDQVYLSVPLERR